MSRSNREADFEGKWFPGERLVRADYEWAIVAPFSKLANHDFDAGSEYVNILAYSLLKQL